MMSSVLLVFSGVVFLCSVLVLIRKRPGDAPATFLLLGFLHGFVGIGYLFLGMYEHWSWGERYPTWADLDLTETTYSYILVLCLTLLALSYIRLRSSVMRPHASLFCLRSFSVYEFLIALVLVSIYIVGIKFGTLRLELGATVVVLPFRLNGIIEVVTLFLLPLYISLRLHRLRGGFWFGLAIMAAYGAINLTSFASKNSAIYPLAVFMSVVFLTGRLTVARIFMPALVVFSVYTVINPWYFSEEILYGTEMSRIQLLKESSQTVESASMSEHGLMGSRNFSHRMTGIMPMQIAIDDSVPVWESITSRGIVMDVRRYYNEDVRPTPFWSTNATGHFAFFMFAFGNHILGFCVGWLLLVVFFYVCWRLDREAGISGTPQQSLLGLTFVLMIVPFLLDGNYDNVSGYIHLVSSLLAVRFIFSRLLSKPLPADSSTEELGTSSHENQDTPPANGPAAVGEMPP